MSRMEGARRYVNLSGGAGRAQGDDVYVYLRSSHVEANAWASFFWHLPADMLYRLGHGQACLVEDWSENTPSKVERIGVPVIRYVLGELWSVPDQDLPSYLKDSYELALRQVKADDKLVRHLRCFDSGPSCVELASRCWYLASHGARTAERLEHPDHSDCTGVMAMWCPIHGGCLCHEDELREQPEGPGDSDGCPLHGQHRFEGVPA